MPKRRPFEIPKCCLLEQLEEKEKTTQQVAEHFGVSRRAIYALIRQYGVKSWPARYRKRKPSEERRKRAMELYQDGFTQKQVGKALGISQQRVSKFIRGE